MAFEKRLPINTEVPPLVQVRTPLTPYDCRERQIKWERKCQEVKLERNPRKQRELLKQFCDEEKKALRQSGESQSRALDGAKKMLNLIDKGFYQQGASTLFKENEAPAVQATGWLSYLGLSSTF